MDKESIKIKMQNLSRMIIGIKIKKRLDNQPFVILRMSIYFFSVPELYFLL